MNTHDHIAISEMLSLVGHVFDDGRLDEIGSVFTADVVYDMRALGMPVIEGIDGAREAARQMGAHGPIAHLVTNVVIAEQEAGDEVASDEVVGNEVAVDSKGLMLMADGSVNAVVNHDVVRRETGGWRIARRLIALPTAAGGA
ncbi:nuclear transport factor 2 family protein [Curtobacterium sp. MCSS17_011]|uniref:nuclear transport factor 2 family protein n=1 Tax=Curtobacterium sp. MCSS17_011 TaxID=2175643 RepID=UPI000D869DBB|nr:nuclear transport factor 2 family protein [Curtobacterium sp. MCSS17_011]PYY56535.1 nuclear transport factor 2 family protein [Curtobacterium sp. MCSS17_011]